MACPAPSKRTSPNSLAALVIVVPGRGAGVGTAVVADAVGGGLDVGDADGLV